LNSLAVAGKDGFGDLGLEQLAADIDLDFVTNGDGKLTVIDDQLFEDRVREFTITKHQQVEISTYWLTDPLIASLDADGSVIIDWPTGFWARWTYRSYDPPQ
jgi:hypothetical protein